MELNLTYLAMVLVAVLLSMTLHEAMHAYAGHWLGDDTARVEGRLTLNPLAHIDPFLTIGLPLVLGLTAVLTGAAVPIFGGAKPVPFNPSRVRYGDYGAALVGLAGPLTNLVLAFLLFSVYTIAGQPQGIGGQFLEVAVLVNLGFFLFNMIPLPPLDGSRVLYAVAPDAVRDVMDVIERNGLLVVFAVVLLFGQAISSFIGAASGVVLKLFYAIFHVVGIL